MLLECNFCEAIVDAKEIAQFEYDEQYEPGSEGTVEFQGDAREVSCM
jgi:hypothetical protein